jgi:hypothetical protein
MENTVNTVRLGSFSIRIQGPLVWNSLDDSLEHCPSISSFKSKLKIKLLAG